MNCCAGTWDPSITKAIAIDTFLVMAPPTADLRGLANRSARVVGKHERRLVALHYRTRVSVATGATRAEKPRRPADQTARPMCVGTKAREARPSVENVTLFRRVL